MEPELPTSGSSDSGLRDCCRETVRTHATHNPMVLCQVCNFIIKCFTDESAFANYVRFCQSRSRSISVDRIDRYQVVVFRAYEPYR